MMNTFQFISSFGGAGAPEGTENTEEEQKEYELACAKKTRSD
jgi:hypothetical protein